MEVVLCVFVQPTLQAWVLLFSSNSGLWFLAASWAARRESENSTVSVLFQRVTGQNLFGLCQVAYADMAKCIFPIRNLLNGTK